MDSPLYVKYLLQNRFAFFISLFGLSAHAHYVGLVVAYTCNREKKMFVALGKEFDMSLFLWILITERLVNCEINQCS